MINLVKTEIVASMKAKTTQRTQALRNINNALQAYEKESDNPNEAGYITVLDRLVKQRTQSIEQYQAGGRHDLANEETLELNVIKEFLPQRLSEDEIQEVANEVIDDLQATSMRDMGKVMGEMKARLGSSATPSDISRIVKQLLS